MRIISGEFKGRKILDPKDKTTRPLKDLTKESIFNIILHSNKFDIDLKNSIVLDLFSGVGSFGIECLSRGSKKVVFVENYKNVLGVLRQNLINLKIKKNKFLIFENEILNGLDLGELKIKFDIVFLDPPYREKNMLKILDNISEQNILHKNSLIIFHRHKKMKDQFSKKFRMIENKNYGVSKIIFGNLL